VASAIPEFLPSFHCVILSAAVLQAERRISGAFDACARVRSLPCKPQQRKNINPQHGHEMPVPRRNVNHNPASSTGRCSREVITAAQSNATIPPPGAPHAPPSTNKRKNCSIRIDEEPAGLQFAPGHPLPRQKTKAQQHGHTQPRKTFSSPIAMPGIDCSGASAARRAIPRRAASIVKLLISSNAVLMASSIHGNCTWPSRERRNSSRRQTSATPAAPHTRSSTR